MRIGAVGHVIACMQRAHHDTITRRDCPVVSNCPTDGPSSAELSSACNGYGTRPSAGATDVVHQERSCGYRGQTGLNIVAGDREHAGPLLGHLAVCTCELPGKSS